MKSFTKIIFCLSFCFIISSCKKDNNFPSTPNLTVRSFEQLNQNLAIWKIGFTDGDGDIGVRNDNDPDNFIVTVISVKNGQVTETPTGNYRIPVVQNIRTAKGVEGEFEFRLETDLYRFFFDSLGRAIRIDSLSLQGYVIDRSGKESNTVQTPIFKP